MTSQAGGASSGHLQPPIWSQSPQVVNGILSVLNPHPQARAEKNAGLRPDEDMRLRDAEQADQAPIASGAHLGKAALVVEDAQNAIGLQ